MHPKLQKLIEKHEAGVKFDITIKVGGGDEDWYISKNKDGTYWLNHSNNSDVEAICFDDIGVYAGDPVECSLCLYLPDLGDCDMTIWEPRVMIPDFFGT